jgi:hypothetical protein
MTSDEGAGVTEEQSENLEKAAEHLLGFPEGWLKYIRGEIAYSELVYRTADELYEMYGSSIESVI